VLNRRTSVCAARPRAQLRPLTNCSKFPNGVPWVTAQSDPRRHSGGQEGAMRAYLTVAGMALGLVALWAALVPLLA
jgi:hypothetical protein